MSDAPDILVLVMLRRLDAKMDLVVADLREVKGRVSTLERQVGQMQSTEQDHYATIMVRLDVIESLLVRLEQVAV